MRNRNLPFVCLLLYGLAGFSATSWAGAIGFRVSPVFSGPELRLHVEARFRGDADGTTILALPHSFGSVQHLNRCIESLQVSPLLSDLQFSEDSSFVTVHHAPGQNLLMSYRVVQDFENDQLSMRYGLRPLLQPEWFHVLGNCLFLLPDGWNNFDVTIDWTGFPSYWNIHNSFGSQQQHQQFQAVGTNWLESVFVGGDFRILEAEVFEQPVFLALRGDDWAFSDSSLLALLQQTIAIQREFWQDRDIPYYTMTLLPLAPRPGMAGSRNFAHYQYMGMGLTNSFAAFATPSPQLSIDDLSHLFHHELMHDWIGCKIRNGGPAEDMQFGWFSEGFTEYFAYKNMLAGGVISPEQYVERLNFDFFDPLYSEPMGQVSNKLVATGFFHCRDIAQLHYWRGCVFAFYLDNRIKMHSEGQQDLHDFMLEMLDYYYESNVDLYNNFDFFLKNLSRYLGEDATPYYHRFVLQGELIPPNEFQLPPYWKIFVDSDGLPILQLDQTAPGWREGMQR